MIPYVTAGFALSMFAVGAWAQNSPPHQNQHSQVAVIDGSAHPELISDSIAYRLYFVTVSELPSATQEARARQNAHLGHIGLNDSDRVQLIAILSEFKSQYLALIERFNQAATAALAHGMQPDLTTFLRQREDLVQSTRNAITRTLSTQGNARLNAHVQSEKNNMRTQEQKSATGGLQ